MSDTITVLATSSTWEDVSGGTPYGYFTNFNDQYILFREAKIQPPDFIVEGHRLNPGAGQQYALTGQERIWCRAVQTLNTPARVVVTRGYGTLTTSGHVSRDFLQEVNEGKAQGHVLSHKFGENSSLGGSFEDVWEQGGVLQWLTTAEQMSVASTDTINDIAPGPGAHSVLIEGLDVNFDEIQEIVILGATPTLTAQSFRRINDVTVVNVGTYNGSNMGGISITANVAGTVQAFIGVMIGSASQTHYTIPANKTGFFVRIGVTVDANKPIDLNLLSRERADVVIAPFGAVINEHQWRGIASPINSRIFANHRIIEKTDVWFEGMVTSGPDGVVDVEYDILLVDN